MKKIGLSIAVVFLLVFLCGYAGASGKSDQEASMAPGAPSALRLMIVPNGFKLTWKLSPQDSGNVTGYEIARSNLASGPFIKVANVDKGISQYVDTSAKPENIYYYQLRAIAGNAYSPYSNTVTGER